MKKLLSRLSSSRSLARPLWTVAVAVVAFAALELLTIQPAHAGIVCCTNSSKTDCLCDSSTVCNITRNGKFYGFRDGLRTCWNLSSYGSASQIKSTITCDHVNGTGTTTLDPTSFTQNALLKCEVTDSLHDDVGLCQFDINYSRSNPALRTCTPAGGNTIATWQASCSEATGGNPDLAVSGTLKCPATLQPAQNSPACANTVPNTTLTPAAGATTVGMTGVTFTAGSAVFAKTDVGKEIVNIESGGTGKATITGFTSTTVVTGTIDVAFDNLITIPSKNWRLTTEFGGSPLGCGLPAFCDGNQDCILNLGIDGVSPGQCPTVFPAGTEMNPQVPGLLAGQVLHFSQTIQGSCSELDMDLNTQVLAFGSLEATRYCNSGLFANTPGLPVDCTPNQGPPLSGLGSAQSAVQFDVKFSPTTLNINCGTNNNDTWRFTITANQHLTDLTRIVPSSLAVEGVSGQVTCDTVTSTATTRNCQINACQPNPQLKDLATVVCNTNPKGSADLTVTGTLNDGIPIFGEDLGHKTSGQCQPL